MELEVIYQRSLVFIVAGRTNGFNFQPQSEGIKYCRAYMSFQFFYYIYVISIDNNKQEL